MQLHDLLLNSAAEHPEAPLVWDCGQWHSYADVLSAARRLARFLTLDCALPRGSRVALYWANGPEAVAASFGVWMAGCVLVALNTELRGDALAYHIEHSDAAVVIAGQGQMPYLSAIADKLGEVVAIVRPDGAASADSSGDDSGRGGAGAGSDANAPGGAAAAELLASSSARLYSWDEVVGGGPELTAPVRTIDVDLASIVYTSGSTGEPKGVMLSHLNLVSNMRSIATYLELSSGDRIMMILPHFYIYGLSLVLTHVLVGGSIVIDNRFMYPNTVLDTMVATNVTGFAGVPSTFSILLAGSRIRDMQFPALRYLTQAGGAMPPTVQQDVAAAFAPARLYIMYGATEAAPRLSYLDPDDLPRKWGSIGKPVPNVDLFVADEEGVPVAPGTEGELVARGSNITSGYWKAPDATAEVLRDGLYFTGDLGVEDEERFLFVTGRAKEMIKVKGFRVSPRQIEDQLVQLPGVAEAAVVGISDRFLGETPVAFIVPADGSAPQEHELRAALAARLPAYMIPTRIFRVDELPRSAAGKVQKLELTARAREALND
ncbi:MAG: class I adenylate-forming enzyme family protein [Spirochaetia bacterium]